ncbi:toxin-antitoxin system, antitoxin component, AbrB domain protein [Streptomyces ipomoeae 91-03]|uniref:Toxin-antitoxin system, antitoxin component, AbrB domain protein n=1 Tax=Streptomyces ipomoeae 91-03 TaxID=698759 RepID=L1KRK8_9ACTN|nr:toxin-antitoxin system, antitoxin component, AbrB domain protein [Streptomyces ipomoeae 91-03]
MNGANVAESKRLIAHFHVYSSDRVRIHRIADGNRLPCAPPTDPAVRPAGPADDPRRVPVARRTPPGRTVVQ